MAPLIKRSGFTLVELLVTVLLIGIIAGVAIPNYTRMLENNRAENAVGLMKKFAMANRMYGGANGTYTSGVYAGTCGCGVGASPCFLVGCKFMAAFDDASDPYLYATVNPFAAASTNCGGITSFLPNLQWLACAHRKMGAPFPYSFWGYGMDVNGMVYGSGGAPVPPAGL